MLPSVSRNRQKRPDRPISTAYQHSSIVLARLLRPAAIGLTVSFPSGARSTRAMANSSQVPTFADVAILVAGEVAPSWLPAHLEWWAAGVRYDLIEERLRPSSSESRARLKALVAAAGLIVRELESPQIRPLLFEQHPQDRLKVSSWAIQDLVRRAEFASISPLLTSADGHARRGRSKPKIPGVFDARTLCATRILELWRFFRRHVPGVKSRPAAAAADAYWLACGAQRSGCGDPINGWYNYFKTVREQSGAPGLKQLIWSRDLEQAERRGGPPWYLGTYYPVESREFRSSSQEGSLL